MTVNDIYTDNTGRVIIDVKLRAPVRLHPPTPSRTPRKFVTRVIIIVFEFKHCYYYYFYYTQYRYIKYKHGRAVITRAQDAAESTAEKVNNTNSSGIIYPPGVGDPYGRGVCGGRLAGAGFYVEI